EQADAEIWEEITHEISLVSNPKSVCAARWFVRRGRVVNVSRHPSRDRRQEPVHLTNFAFSDKLASPIGQVSYISGLGAPAGECLGSEAETNALYAAGVVYAFADHRVDGSSFRGTASTKALRIRPLRGFTAIIGSGAPAQLVAERLVM